MAKLYVFSGPSGAGKGTILARVLNAVPGLWFSVSCTTRAPRVGEMDGVHYRFISEAQFDGMIERGEFLEYDRHFSASYGTPRAPIEERLVRGISCVLDIEPNGAQQVFAQMPEAVGVFIVPPSRKALETRLRGRGTENAAQIKQRLERAQAELAERWRYAHVVVNDDLRTAVAEVIAIIENTCNNC